MSLFTLKCATAPYFGGLSPLSYPCRSPPHIATAPDLFPQASHPKTLHHVEPLFECLALKILHDQVLSPALEPDVVEGAYVLVLEREIVFASRSRRLR